MAENPTAQAPAPPVGEDTPEVLYIAVGMAIHAWEGLEAALASLYLTMTQQNVASIEALAKYGNANKRFTDRMRALRNASR